MDDFDIQDFLNRSQETEKQRIEHELERIAAQLEHRDQIFEETVDELESKRDWYRDRLDKLYRQSWGKLQEKQRLKDRIEAFYRELRTEKRSHWHDRQQLEQERRELLREFDDVTTDWLQDLL